MKVTVIFPDNVIVVDGDAAYFQPGELKPADPNHRVIQWEGENGWIEVYKGERIWLEADDEDELAGYLEQHADRFEAQENMREAQEAHRLAVIQAEQEETERHAREAEEEAAERAAKEAEEQAGEPG